MELLYFVKWSNTFFKSFNLQFFKHHFSQKRWNWQHLQKKMVGCQESGNKHNLRVKHSSWLSQRVLYKLKVYVIVTVAGQLAMELLYFEKLFNFFFKSFKSSILQASFYLLLVKQQQSLAKMFCFWDIPGQNINTLAYFSRVLKTHDFWNIGCCWSTGNETVIFRKVAEHFLQIFQIFNSSSIILVRSDETGSIQRQKKCFGCQESGNKQALA